LEAISLGFGIIGSDISEKAVEDTKANIKWLISKFECQNSKQIPNLKFQISKQDATRFDFSKIEQDFVVVTEPYLGKPRKSKLRIEDEKEIREEAVELYIDFLQNLKLTADSQKLKAVCIVLPLFELANGKQLSIWENCVDTLREIGYTTNSQPLIYGRDYQIVKRQIVVLKIRSTNIEARNKP
jgi:tRNA G10  N-methylase Trm11